MAGCQACLGEMNMDLNFIEVILAYLRHVARLPGLVRVLSPIHYVNEHQRAIFGSFWVVLLFLRILRKVLDIFMPKE